MVSPIASDIYLPSFPEISIALSASASQVQLTFTFFLIGFSFGQLILGPTSDRFGRRRTLIVALTVFVLASVATAFAPTLWVLLLFRFLQGLSGAGAVVLARAIAADLTRGRETVRALSLIASFVGLGPILGPSVGAIVGDLTNWRGVLGTVAILALLMLVLTLGWVPESHPPHARHTGGVTESLRNFKQLLSDGGFVLLLLTFATSFATMIAYIAASPFVAQVVLGMTPLEFAIGFGIGAIALTASSFTNAQLARRTDPARALLSGTILSLATAILILVFVLTGTLTIPLFVGLAFSMVFGVGLSMANASALAFLRAGFARGSASALLGSTQFLLGAALTPVVGAWGEGTAVPMAVTLVVASAVAGVSALLHVRRDARPGMA